MNISTRKTVTAYALLMLSIVFGSHANSESIRHFDGKTVNNYSEAVATLKTYNKKVADILSKEAIELSDLGKIHELTYTLENALQRMQSDISVTAELLEKLHKASEHTDIGKAKTLGESYLEESEQLMPGKH